MLSKKMAVSLTSLIIILALAFVASPALAAEIKVKLVDSDGIRADNQGDLSKKAGIQVRALSNVKLEYETDEVFGGVDTDGADATSTAFDIISSGANAPTITVDGGVTRSADGKKYTVTLTSGDGASSAPHGTTVTVYLKPDTLTSITTGTAKHAGVAITLEYVYLDLLAPAALSMMRSGGQTHALFEESVTYNLLLSEEPSEGIFGKAQLKPTNAVIDAVNLIGTVEQKAYLESQDKTVTDSDGIISAITGEGGLQDKLVSTEVNAPGSNETIAKLKSTASAAKLYRYGITIKPTYDKKDDVKIKVLKFKDNFGNESGETEYSFAVAASAVAAKPKDAGLKLSIPNDIIVPAGGYLVLGRNDSSGADNHEERTNSTQIIYPGDPTKSLSVGDRQPNQLKYNLIKFDLPNLETFLGNGGTIDVTSDGLIVSEIMWVRMRV